MKVICLLLFILSLTSARVYPRTGVNDVLDGVEGVIYDVPEYEDPEVSLFKLIARGILPVYTIRDTVKDSKESPNKDDKPHYETDDIKKGLDAVIAQLQEAKNKLENGNNGIYLDIDKSVLNLENLKHWLYLDLHTSDVSAKQPAMPDTVAEEPSDKASTDKYSVLRASLKKYLSSDGSIYKYQSFDVPAEKPLLLDNSDNSFFGSVSALLPYSAPNTFVEQPPVDDHTAEKPFETDSSEDQNLPSDTEHLLSFAATTEQPIVSDKGVFKYQILRPETPPIEVIPEEKKVKTYMADDVVSSAETDKVDQGNKTFLHKKWSLKLSSAM